MQCLFFELGTWLSAESCISEYLHWLWTPLSQGLVNLNFCFHRSRIDFWNLQNMGINMSLSLGSFHGAPNVTLWPFQQFAQENFLEILSIFFIQSDGRPVPTFYSRFSKKNRIEFISQSQILKKRNSNDLNNLKRLSSVLCLYND